MMFSADITVIIPVYNNSIYLKDAVNSILKQEGAGFNLFVIDDGSEEDIYKIIEQMNDERIKYIRLQRVGLIDALNKGIELCQSKYLAVMDSDDIAAENRLKEQYEFLETHPKVGAVGTSIKYFTDNRNNATWGLMMPENHSYIIKGLLKGRRVFVHPTIMIRTELIKRIGGYRSESYPVPDVDLFLRIAKTSELANISNIYSFFRLHERSFTTNHFVPIIEKNLELIRGRKPNKFIVYKNLFSLMNYRKGIIKFLNRNYLVSLGYFFMTFLISPLQSLHYLTKKVKINL